MYRSGSSRQRTTLAASSSTAISGGERRPLPRRPASFSEAVSTAIANAAVSARAEPPPSREIRYRVSVVSAKDLWVNSARPSSPVSRIQGTMRSLPRNEIQGRIVP